MALLQRYFDNETIASFTSNTLLDEPLPVVLPPMKFLNHSFDEKLAISNSLAYDVDHVINATKQDANIYRFMVDPILFGDLIIPTPFFFTPPGYLLIATSSFAVCNTLFTFWLAYRLRLTHAAMMGLLHHTHARTLPPYLIATILPVGTPSSIFTINADDSIDYLVYVILALLLFFLCRKIYKCRSTRFVSSPDFEMCLEIKSKGKCIFLALQRVSGCPTDYVITGSTQNSHLSVHGWIRPYLSITWGDLHIAHAQSGRPLLLTTRIHISFIHRFKLGSIFTNHYECFLFFDHAGRGAYVTTLPRNMERVTSSTPPVLVELDG